MSELVVGAGLMNLPDFDRLPVGTVIGPAGTTEEYTRTMSGWESTDGVVMDVTEFSLRGYNSIKALPKDAAVLWESMAQWQWRFRDNALLSAEQAGVSRATVNAAMQELGITDDRFPLGRGVVLGSEYDKGRLADGTQVVLGDPARVDRFGLYVKQRGGWTHLLGDRSSHAGHRVTVINGPEAPWATTPGTEAEQEALANFKARAWRVGWKVKLNNRWCESYENYMAQIGLTEDVLHSATYEGIAVGERVNPGMAASLPVGSVLRWVSRSDSRNFTWYIRDDTMRNEAKTRAVFGHRRDGSTLRNLGSTMEVLWIANAEAVMSVRVDDLRALVEHLPAGTRFTVGGSEYVLCPDRKVTTWNGRVAPATGTWEVEQLGTNVAIAGFPS